MFGDDLEDELLDELDDDLEGLGDYLDLSEEQLLGELGKAKARGKVKKARKITKTIKIKRAAKAHGVTPRQIMTKRKQARQARRAMKGCADTGVRFSGQQGLFLSEPQGCVPVSPTPQPLYDIEQLKSSQSADITFFATPLGQTSSVGATSFSKTDFHTNMTQSKVLPSPQQYALDGMSWYTSAGGNVSDGARDFIALRNNVVLQFYLGSNVHIQVPLMSVPQYAPAAFGYDGSTVGTSGWTNNSIPMYDFQIFNPSTGKKEPIRIKAGESFMVKAKFAGTTTVTADLKLGIILHGTLFREIR